MEINQINSLSSRLNKDNESFSALVTEVRKIIIGHDDIIESILIAILCNGHILLEGVPGIAKTTLIKTVAQAIGLDFKRIQFTPDLLPADLIGTLIYNPKNQEFETKKGPIFSHIILADEINRAPAKVQSALLEAMQEQQVTIGSQTFKLDLPFLVFATQNPIEQEGTYSLPEAQVDRFMFKLIMHYPTIDQEREILKRSLIKPSISSVLTQNDLFSAQQLVKDIYIDDKISHYIVDIVTATRKPGTYGLNELVPYILYGASPRATIAINYACRAHAFLQKRHFVTPDDVKAVCTPILRHRIALTYEAEAQHITSDYIVQRIIRIVPTP